MASDSTIRAALDAAAQMACFGGTEGDQCDRCAFPRHCDSVAAYRKSTAAAIAAFLRAMPDTRVRLDTLYSVGIGADAFRALAGTVEEAARDE